MTILDTNSTSTQDTHLLLTKKQITIQIESCAVSSKESKQVEISTQKTANKYIFNLTCPNNLIFYYKSEISKQEYEKIKKEQNLLISFDEFFTYLSDLFDSNFCILFKQQPEQQKSTGLCDDEFVQKEEYLFSVLEINKFKQIIHISIPFYKASSFELERLLVFKLEEGKSLLEKKELEFSEFVETEKRIKNDLGLRLSQLSKEYELVKREFEDGKIKFKQELELKNGNCDLLKKEVDGLKMENNKIYKKLKEIENKAKEEELRNSEFKRELKMKEEIISDLKRSLEEKDKKCFEVKGKCEELEWNQIRKLNSKIKEFESENEELRRKHDRFIKEEYESLKAENSVYLTQLTEIRQELNKANEIIRKLQNENRTCKASVKQKNLFIAEQEERFVEIESKLKELEVKNSDYDEIKRVSLELEEKCKLYEGRVRDNQQIIDYLHKQLNQNKISASSLNNNLHHVNHQPVEYTSGRKVNSGGVGGLVGSMPNMPGFTTNTTAGIRNNLKSSYF